MRGYDFHRQKPLDHYIVDFFCNELMLAIEIDGHSHNQITEKMKSGKENRKAFVSLFSDLMMRK
jgi:very-short-patch-repair endonuclease